MEFPDLGQHCCVDSCNLLDFLPMKCDACQSIFCKNHINYETHQCSSGLRKNVQVPVCPLCNQPVPSKRGEAPDIAVGAHIDRDCQSDPAKSHRKIYTNSCSYPKCKKRELVPILCQSCRLNFCLKHRHGVDHDCKGYEGSGQSMSSAGSAALSRLSQTKSNLSAEKGSKVPAQGNSAKLQPTMAEDEALALALQLSLNEDQRDNAASSLSTGSNVAASARNAQEAADRALAKALADSEQEFLRQQQHTSSSTENKSDKCLVS